MALREGTKPAIRFRGRENKHLSDLNHSRHKIRGFDRLPARKERKMDEEKKSQRKRYRNFTVTVGCHGFAVTMGCSTFYFSDADSLSSAIQGYLLNPQLIEQDFLSNDHRLSGGIPIAETTIGSVGGIPTAETTTWTAVNR